MGITTNTALNNIQKWTGGNNTGVEGSMDTYKKLLPQIRCIVKRLENFNTAYELEDYFQEAAVACLEAEKRYKKATEDGRIKMQETVHAIMYIQKYLYAMADTGEVVYEVYSPLGDYVKTIHNNEYRKTRKKLTAEGCTFRSVRLVESIHKEDADGNLTEMQIEGGMNGYGDEDFDRN